MAAEDRRQGLDLGRGVRGAEGEAEESLVGSAGVFNPRRKDSGAEQSAMKRGVPSPNNAELYWLQERSTGIKR